jgi:uncharacterized protein YbjT (DUF2867 family)
MRAAPRAPSTARPAGAIAVPLAARPAPRPAAPRRAPPPPRAQPGDGDGGEERPEAPPPAADAAAQPQQPPAVAAAAADGGGGAPAPRARRRRRAKMPAADAAFSLDNLNPVSMGKKSRAVFDDVWTQLQRIGGPSRSVDLGDGEWAPAEGAFGEAFASPAAAATTVLVLGATGRVGRVLVRKLLLRGYRVRALVRARSLSANEDSVAARELIPQSVEVVEGDVGDYAAVRRAVAGADKVVVCSAARSALTADLLRVEADGVANVARALQDARNAAARKGGAGPAAGAKIDVADFAREEYHPLWDVEHVGPPARSADSAANGAAGLTGAAAALTGRSFARQRAAAAAARDAAEAYISADDSLVFEGAVFSRDGYAEVGAALGALPHGGSLAGAEGLLLRVLGDGQAYSVVAEDAGGAAYAAKFVTRPGWATVRLPFSLFAPVRAASAAAAAAAALDPAASARLKLRFEPRFRALDGAVTDFSQPTVDESGNRFRLEVDWVKALPGGAETDVILVSCAGAPRPGLAPDALERLVAAKRRGEAALRNSGLGYTVVRPGPLEDAAGGYRALVFDQGNRISQGIAAADVADVCLKSLHDPGARNVTFEVCWEYAPEAGLESYELVAHLPDKANNYLAPALATLEKNT